MRALATPQAQALQGNREHLRVGEEITDRVELITKEIEGHTHTAIRFYLNFHDR